jgi:predicted HTH domain antitoxin
MTVEVPETAIRPLQFTNEEARVDYAVGLYTGRKVSMGKAAKIAGLGYIEFRREIGARGVCLNYGVEDLSEDLKAWEDFDRETQARR